MGTPSAITEVSIANAALTRVGSTQVITSFNDGSNEARQCAIWYPQLRDAVLADFPWPWAEAEVALAQVQGPETTGTRARAQWARSYRYPTDCLKLRRIVATPAPLSGSPVQTTGILSYPQGNEPWRRAVGQPNPITYTVGSDSEGRLILTDAYGCGYGLTAVYTQAISDPTQFSPDFADALAWRLAIDLAQGLAFSSDKRQAADQGYDRTIRKARATAINETQDDLNDVRYQSLTVRARWG